MKKILFLFLALLLPVLIFLFLKSFGKNEFEVPVLFSDSVQAPVACNQYTYQAPYKIADSVLQKFSWNDQDTLTIVIFEDQNKVNQHEISIHVERTLTEFKDMPFQLVQMFNEKMIIDLKRDKVVNLSLHNNEFESLRSCVFLLSPENNAVIIDHHKRIRGQYNLVNRDDADRMIMQEMNILFKRY